MNAYPPQEGQWRLIAPNGQEWTGDRPLATVAAEMKDRVPPEIQLARIKALAAEPLLLDDLGKTADTVDNLLAAMSLPLPAHLHLSALRESLPALRDELKRIYAAYGGET